MSKSFQRSIFGVSVLLLLLTVWGGLRSNVRADQKDGAYPEMEVYSEVLNKIQNDYVVDPNMSNVTVGALHGLLESLDSDSSYLTPAEYKLYKQHLSEGTAQVGLNVSKRYGYATVVSVVKGSPADKEQIQDGDLIEAIGNQSTREMSLAMIRLLLEGPAGTNVTISVVRPRKPEPDKITMTRSNVPVPPVSDQLYENASILYIKPNALTKDRVNEIESKLKGLGKGDNKETKKVLLDLRDVAVGDEAQGIRLANFFLQSGTIATLSGQKYPERDLYGGEVEVPDRGAAGGAGESWHVGTGRAGGGGDPGQQARRCGGRPDLRRRLGAEDDGAAGWLGADPVGGEVCRAGWEEDPG